MVDLTELPAAEMAAQLARPTGEVGIAVGEYMHRINFFLNKAAYALLAPLPHSRLLEIGFGNGNSIGELMNMAPGCTYTGVEASETMLREGVENNRALIQEGRVELHLGRVEELPFPAAAFDRALAVNTIYFWLDQRAGLAEIRRVLQDDGFLVLASMTPETSAKSPTARPEYGFQVPERHSLELLHRQAGFGRVACELYEEQAKRLDGTLFQRVYHMVIAHAGNAGAQQAAP